MKKRTTIVVQNEPLENVLAQISKQTGVRFSYNSQLINPKTKITINAQNKTINEILSVALPSSVSYKKVGEHVVFFAERRKQETEGDGGTIAAEPGETESGKKEKEGGRMETEEQFLLLSEEKVAASGTDSFPSPNPNRHLMTEEVEIEEDEKSPSNFERVDGEAGRGSLYENIEEDEIKQENTEKNTPPNNGAPAIDCLDSISLTKNEDMKNQIAGILMAVATATTPLAAQDTLQTDSVQSVEMQQQTKCKPAQLTFIYPLGTGGANSSENCYHFSVNVLGGVTGQTNGFEAGGLFNINQYGNWGAQFAGLFNIAGTKKTEMMSHNVQFAGLFNHTQKGTSVQFAGLWNTGDTAYLQGAGLFNVAKEVNFQGACLFNIAKKADVQAAGLFNTSTESYAQLAGLFNQGEAAHFQAAGLWNNAKETKCQLAGLVNIAQESSCQIAGILNITKKGRFQMGLINVRDTADGVSLGLINIVKKGGVLEAGIEAGEFVHTAVTFRSGVRQLYSIIYIGCNFSSTHVTWAIGAGLGTSVKLVGNLSLDFELTHASFYTHWFVNNWGTALTQFRPVLNYRFAKHFKMYAGPTLNLLYAETEHWWGVIPPKMKVPYSLLHRSYSNTTLDMWIGVVGGIKF